MSKETDPFLDEVTLPVLEAGTTTLPPQEMVRSTQVAEMSVQTDVPEEYLPFRQLTDTGGAEPHRECTCGAKDVVASCSTAVSPPATRIISHTSVGMVDVCRICHCESEPGDPLISPCACSGTLKWVHQSCLQHWLKSSDTKSCELCKYDFQMTTRIEPFRKDVVASCSTAVPPPVARNPSHTSLSSVGMVDVCRICHCESEPGAPLISPCACSGTLKWVHQSCLQQWIKSSDTKSCELCKYDFQMTTRIKPFRKWKKLEMTTVERRKIMCSVTFHIIAITCVIWSLYVLIDRTTEEIREGKLEWPFWTKLIVVAIGFTGGLVFMYVQCKMYVQLCRRWRAYNRVIYIQDSPIGPPPLPQTPQ